MKRVLVVDDSLLMTKVISDIINSIPDFKVCAVAKSGEEAIDKFIEHKPDIVTLDFELPDHNGLWVLKHILEDRWVPVIMVSAHTRDGAEVTLECLEQGAVDFIAKPSGTISLDLKRDMFIDKLNHATYANPVRHDIVVPKLKAKPGFNCVGIGSSTGGVKALLSVLPALPADFPGSIMVVQHMPKEFTRTFAQRLNNTSKLKVIEAQGYEDIRKGMVFIAPGGQHMTIKGNRVQITNDPPIWGVRPAADRLFPAIAQKFGTSAIGVVITGMGRDGANGIKEIKEQGGKTIAEDPNTAFIKSMPQNAIKTGCVDFIVPLAKIAQKIVELVSA
ncbi:MAG TPA: chemotaxis-specific protein-glutamate methyltransferase CheB [bacterium (Candidatus Stahlbacteria)]|nr:chemotaxis-specific protein-glutamate methyltransferase CheB [Candidatus Stahlbacteria bacterium]